MQSNISLREAAHRREQSSASVAVRLSPVDAAAYIGTSVSYLNRKRVEGGGPVFIKIGRTVRYDTHDLDDYLTARRRTSTSDTGLEAS